MPINSSARPPRAALRHSENARPNTVRARVRRWQGPAGALRKRACTLLATEGIGLWDLKQKFGEN
jgi:hypothetical protein